MKENMERKIKVSHFYHDMTGLLVALFGRWIDESDFEDIGEYGKIIEPKVQAIGGTNFKMTAKPFGFVFDLEDARYKFSLSVSRGYSYKRIK